jgi:hypothetical protein
MATAPELAGVSGRYFYKLREAHSTKRSHDEAIAAELWRRSEALTAFTYPQIE